jgi:hypothetical protein
LCPLIVPPSLLLLCPLIVPPSLLLLCPLIVPPSLLLLCPLIVPPSLLLLCPLIVPPTPALVPPHPLTTYFLFQEVLEVGTLVEAQFDNKRKWYKGTITAVHMDPQDTANNPANATYSIDYEDGDSEDSVPASSIRPCGKLGGMNDRGGESSDDDEEAKEQRRAMDKVRRLEQEEAEAEKRAEEEKLRKEEKDDRERRAKYRRNELSEEEMVEMKAEFEARQRKAKEKKFWREAKRKVMAVGMVVEAKFDGGSEYYRGRIKKVHLGRGGGGKA